MANETYKELVRKRNRELDLAHYALTAEDRRKHWEELSLMATPRSRSPGSVTGKNTWQNVWNRKLIFASPSNVTGRHIISA